MANHVDYNTDKRIIYVTTAPTLVGGDWVVDLDIKIDLYSDGKEDWLSNDTLNKFEFPIRSVGGDDLPGEKSLGATFFLDSGWKLKPYEADHVFNVNGNFYSEDGTSPFVGTSGIYNIMIINTVSSLVDSIVQQQAEIEYASFGGGVTLDAVNGSAGTAYPYGTLQEPVNNLTDAMTIASERGFNTIRVLGNLTIDTSGDYSGMVFIGESQSKSLLTISAGANVLNCEFYDAGINGILDGNTRLKNCLINDLNYVYGFIESCVLASGTIILGGSDIAHFLDCWSGVSGVGTPTIDMGGSGQELSFRNYNGGIKLINKTGIDAVSLDINSGQVILDSTVTNGTIVIRGIGCLTDNSTGDAVVVSHTLLDTESIAGAVWDEPLVDHTLSGSSGDALGNVAAGADPGQIADAVWDEELVDHQLPGSAGEALESAQSPVISGLEAKVDTIQVQTDKLTFDGSNNIQARINDAGVLNNLTPGDVADAVWDVVITNHTTPATFGDAVRRTLGLSKNNLRILSQVYDEDGRLTASTIRIFENATDLENNINHIVEYLMTATYDASGRNINYQVKEN